jgi:tight adherence protein B
MGVFLLAGFCFTAALIAAYYYCFVVPRRAEAQFLTARLREVRARSGAARVRLGGGLVREEEAPDFFAKFTSWFGFEARLQKTIEQADLSYRASRVLGLCFVIAVIVFGLANLLGIPIVALQIGLALGAAYLPIAYIGFMRDRRVAKFEHQLPEAIDLFNRSMKAGHNIQSGLQTIAEESLDPIRQEFKKLLEELALGSTTETALHRLGERMPLIDLKFFITGLILQRQTGANMVEVLENLAVLIRERLNLAEKLNAGTAQQRFSAALFCSVPVLMGAIYAFMKPEYFRLLLDDPTGNMILTYAIVSETIGILVIRKLANPKF